MSFLWRALVVTVFAVATIFRFQIPPIPFTGPDSVGYLGAAFNYFAAGQFVGIAERPYPYPSFLLTVLSLFNTVNAIPVLQHLFGLGSGLLFLGIGSLVSKLFLGTPLSRVAWRLVSLVGLFLVLLAPGQILIEHWTHPEAMTCPLVLLCLYLYLKLFEAVREKKTDFQVFVRGTFFLFSLFFIYFFQPRFGPFALVWGLGLTIWLLARHTRKLVRCCVFAGAPLVVVYVSLVLPFGGYSNDDAVRCNRSGALFFYNLNTIMPLVQRDIDAPEPSAEKPLLQSLVAEFEKAKDQKNAGYGTGYFETIGYNSDFLGGAYNLVLQHFKASFVKSADFYKGYLYRALREDPLGLLRKVYLELEHFYGNHKLFPAQGLEQLKKYWSYSHDTVKTWEALFKRTDLYNGYLRHLESFKSIELPMFSQGVFGFAGGILAFLNSAFIPMSIGFLLAILINSYLRTSLFNFGLVTAGVLVFSFCVNLTIAIGGTLVVRRYLMDLFAIHLLCYCFVLAYILLSVVSLSQVLVKRARLGSDEGGGGALVRAETTGKGSGDEGVRGYRLRQP